MANYSYHPLSNRRCSVDGCNLKHWAKNYCVKHYQRVKRHGDVNYRAIEAHGLHKTPEYRVWADIKTRCFNPSFKQYHDYGGRGITMCAKWRNSFTAFLADVGKRPYKGLLIDRINNDGSYEPGNVRWVTRSESERNKRRVK